MNHTENDPTKEKIIAAAITLIQEDEQNISVRKIVQRAGVGVGLVNYYFQSKENLINIAVQRIIDGVIAKVPSLVRESGMPPEEKLRFVMKKTLEYLDSHPNVSRISILSDMKCGTSRDNTQLSIQAFDRILQEIIPDENKRTLAGHILCASMQSVFLRSGVLQETTGFNFHDAEQRSRFVDGVIDTVLNGIGHALP